MIKKITEGYVVQEFDEETKEFIGQEFIAGGDVSFEDEEGDMIYYQDAPDVPYVPFTMEQFNQVKAYNNLGIIFGEV